MNTIKFYVTLEVPDEFFKEENYDTNMRHIRLGVQHIADMVDGEVDDLEIK